MSVGILGILVLVAVAAGWAALLRLARCPGSRIVGGVVAGLVLGPGLLGRALPAAYEALFAGGAAERAALGETEGQLAAHTAVELRTGHALDPQALAELKARRAALEESLHQARSDFQRPQRVLVAIMAAMLLLGAATHTVRPGPRGQAVGGPLSIGAWAAALPGGIAFLALRRFWGADPSCAALAAAALAFGPWALTTIDREAADRAEVGGARTVESAGRVATAIAIVLALGALWHARGATGLPWAAVLGSRAGELALAAFLRPGRALGLLRGALDAVVIPATAAGAALWIDPIEDFSFWPAALILLLSGDGRWLGAVIGAQVLGGRRALRTMRLVLGSMAAGPTQLAVTAVGLGCGSLDPRYALALLLGATILEATAPVRRSLAVRLARTEEEVNRTAAGS